MRRGMNLTFPLAHQGFMYSFKMLDVLLLSHKKKDHMRSTKRIHERRVKAIPYFSSHSIDEFISRFMWEMLVHNKRMPLIVCRL